MRILTLLGRGNNQSLKCLSIVSLCAFSLLFLLSRWCSSHTPRTVGCRACSVRLLSPLFWDWSYLSAWLRWVLSATWAVLRLQQAGLLSAVGVGFSRGDFSCWGAWTPAALSQQLQFRGSRSMLRNCGPLGLAAPRRGPSSPIWSETEPKSPALAGRSFSLSRQGSSFSSYSLGWPSLLTQDHSAYFCFCCLKSSIEQL